MNKSIGLVAGLGLSLGLITSGSAATTYTSVKIATDTESIVVIDFNNASQAITAKWTDAGYENPVIQNWVNGGVSGSPGTAIGAMPGMAKTELRAFNDTLQVVGIGINPAADGTFYPSNTTHVYLYSDGRFTDLSTFINSPGADHSIASGINNQGEVIGTWSETVGGVRHAFLYSRGTMTEILAPGGANTLNSVVDINELGQIVGTYGEAGVLPSPGTMQTFLYDRGTATKIEVGYSNFAVAINDRGEVGGFATTGTRDSRCYFYSNGSVSLLGPTPVETRLVNCNVRGISNTGVMAGNQSGPPGAVFPFVYSNGVMTDLNLLIAPTDPLAVSGTRLQSIVAINDKGEIVAATGSNGYYLLTPVAEASPPSPPPPTPTPPTPPPATPEPPPVTPPTPDPTPVPTLTPTPPTPVPTPDSPPTATSETSAPPPAAAVAAQADPAPASGGGATNVLLIALLIGGCVAKTLAHRKVGRDDASANS